MTFLIDFTILTFEIDQCQNVSKISDGICDLEMNWISCNFDGYDCCPGENCVDIPYSPPAWINDGFCDHAWNYEAFGYDGKDCCSCDEVEIGVPCVHSVSTQFCSDNCGCKRPKISLGM